MTRSAGATLPFDEAVAGVLGSLGVAVDGETIRRLAEGVGAVVEHDQADRTQRAVPAADVPACLLVEADGVHTPSSGAGASATGTATSGGSAGEAF